MTDITDSDESEPGIFANNNDGDRNLDFVLETGTKDLLLMQESDSVSKLSRRQSGACWQYPIITNTIGKKKKFASSIG
ncbi:hypothetical protein HNY73_006393 [Argiope bruennichi]|uniref:Uncharacterized protein n=1 Tax=Argiope bruennichi TaxID=94029 RepID=A0A8T0FKS4_ARGBR|nr:hypothetical protein HNY73_006393 [Argiope bruennichi]